MAKKVKPGKLRGNTTPNLLPPVQDLEESFRMVLEKGIEMSLMGNNVSLERMHTYHEISVTNNINNHPHQHGDF